MQDLFTLFFCRTICDSLTTQSFNFLYPSDHFSNLRCPLWCPYTGRFLAELTHQVFSDLEASKYQVRDL
jgi:hypothetical protein